MQDGVLALLENGAGDLHRAALLAHDLDGAREQVAARMLGVELDQRLEREAGERLAILLQVLDQEPLGLRDLRGPLALLRAELCRHRTGRRGARRGRCRSRRRRSGRRGCGTHGHLDLGGSARPGGGRGRWRRWRRDGSGRRGHRGWRRCRASRRRREGLAHLRELLLELRHRGISRRDGFELGHQARSVVIAAGGEGLPGQVREARGLADLLRGAIDLGEKVDPLFARQLRG